MEGHVLILEFLPYIKKTSKRYESEILDSKFECMNVSEAIGNYGVSIKNESVYVMGMIVMGNFSLISP